MTPLLKRAIEQAEALPDAKQDAIAIRVLEIFDNDRWDELFARDPDLLVELAAEAKREFELGQAKELDWDEL